MKKTFIYRAGSHLVRFLSKFFTRAYRWAIDLPKWYPRQISIFLAYIADFRYKLQHLYETNLQLGLHHLDKGNLNDAILRFKIIEKFLSKNSTIANYWLGWIYFLKNDTKQASKHLNKAGSTDLIQLNSFVKGYSAYKTIPTEIWQKCRDYNAANYMKNFYDKEHHLPYRFVREVLSEITEFLEQYNILELGSNIGDTGYEVRRRFSGNFKNLSSQIN